MSNSKPINASAGTQALSVVLDRQPPQDIQAEIGLLGSIVLLPEVLDQVGPILRETAFFDDAHGKLYRAMVALHDAGKAIDPTLLVDRLKSAGEYEAIGGAAYLSKIVNAVPNAAHATYYAEIIREKAREREIILACTDAIQQVYDGGRTVDEITAHIDRRLLSAGHTELQQVRSISEVAAEAIAEVETAATAPSWPGILTGLARLDEAKGPVLPGEVEIIAARPGNGKTSYATQVAMHNASRGRAGLLVSLEMGGTELAKRVLCGRAQLDSRDVRSGRLDPADIGRLAVAKNELDGLPLKLWSPPTATLGDIRAVARQAKANGGLQLLVIDYIGLIRPEADDRRLPRYEQVTKISAGLKALARELDLPVLALCQLNREAEAEEPRLSHLRESGAIEQDADAVIFLHHPPASRHASEGKVYATGVHLLIAKHRHGERGRVSLLWHPSETRFSTPTDF